MIRNSRELEALRQELIGLAAIKRRVTSMAKNFSVDATDLESLLDDRLQLLSVQVEQYRARECQPRQTPESIDLLRLIGKLPGALIEARVALGWTQCDLARHARMKHQQISRYERSMYAKISLDNAMAIARVLTEQHREGGLKTEDVIG